MANAIKRIPRAVSKQLVVLKLGVATLRIPFAPRRHRPGPGTTMDLIPNHNEDIQVGVGIQWDSAERARGDRVCVDSPAEPVTPPAPDGAAPGTHQARHDVPTKKRFFGQADREGPVRPVPPAAGRPRYPPLANTCTTAYCDGTTASHI